MNWNILDKRIKAHCSGLPQCDLKSRFLELMQDDGDHATALDTTRKEFDFSSFSTNKYVYDLLMNFVTGFIVGHGTICDKHEDDSS